MLLFSSDFSSRKAMGQAELVQKKINFRIVNEIAKLINDKSSKKNLIMDSSKWKSFLKHRLLIEENNDFANEKVGWSFIGKMKQMYTSNSQGWNNFRLLFLLG